MKKSTEILYWLPRVICILAILFISLFATDAFSHETTVWKQIGGFLMHLTPSFILLIFLIIAWKRELAGGIIFIVAGWVMTPLVFRQNYQMNQSVMMSLGIIAFITVPFIVVGALFIVGYYKKKKGIDKSLS